MRFGEETTAIRDVFKEVIKSAGYAVRIMDESEHNNQIVPEMFYEIRRSKFVVVDVTYPNYGAYYEAEFEKNYSHFQMSEDVSWEIPQPEFEGGGAEFAQLVIFGIEALASVEFAYYILPIFFSQLTVSANASFISLVV